METINDPTIRFIERTSITEFLSDHEIIAELHVLICSHHFRAFKEDKKGCLSLFNLAYLICHLATQPDTPYKWVLEVKTSGLPIALFNSACCLALALIRIHSDQLPVSQQIYNRLCLRCPTNPLYKLMEHVINDYQGKLKKPINFSGVPLPPTESPADMFERGEGLISASFHQLDERYQQCLEELQQTKEKLTQTGEELKETKATLAEVKQQLADQQSLYAAEQEKHSEVIASLSQQLEEASKQRDEQTDEWRSYPSKAFKHFDRENIHQAIMEAGKACHGPLHFACLYVICSEYNYLYEKQNKMLFARAIVALGLIPPSEGKGLEETAEQLRSGMTRYINRMQVSRKKLRPNTQRVIEERRMLIEAIFKEYGIDECRS